MNTSKKSRLCKRILMLGTGLISPYLLQSCTTSRIESARIQTVKPPQYLLISCEKPTIERMETNGDLLMYLYKLEYKFDVCAAQIDALSAFYNEVE